MQDQAERLRQLVGTLNSPGLVSPKMPKGRCRIIAVTSGKGGVGKSNLSVNLSLALAQKGLRVLLVDADMGLANVDVLLGIIPQNTLLSVLNGQKSLPEIILEAPGGIRLVASGSAGVQELADLNEAQRNRFLQSLVDLQDETDIILIDTGAGLHRNVLAFALAAEEVLIVTTPEPTALMDAYGMMKVLYKEKKDPVIHVIVNMASHQQEADEAGKKMVVLTKRFLNLDVQYLGFVPRDMAMIRAVKNQKPILLTTANSPAAVSILKLSEKLLQGKSGADDGNLFHFLKRVTQIFGGKKNA